MTTTYTPMIIPEREPDAPLRRSLTEVEIIMQRHLDQGYSAHEAIQLTDITLANVVVP